jgi:hypothetical protein
MWSDAIDKEPSLVAYSYYKRIFYIKGYSIGKPYIQCLEEALVALARFLVLVVLCTKKFGCTGNFLIGQKKV